MTAPDPGPEPVTEQGRIFAESFPQYVVAVVRIEAEAARQAVATRDEELRRAVEGLEPVSGYDPTPLLWTYGWEDAVAAVLALLEEHR